MNFIKQKIKDIIRELMDDLPESPQEQETDMIDKKISIVQAGDLLESLSPSADDYRMITLFSDLDQEKMTDVMHGLLTLKSPAPQSNNGSKNKKSKKNKPKIKPIEFYISTYGGNADDMFAIYDLMRHVQDSGCEIHTRGYGKVMSAGVLLLASGTKGKREIGKNCRVMIHSVNAGTHGAMHDLKNEFEAIQGIQDSYLDALVAETSMTKSQLKKIIERKINVYLSAEEAVDLGIADIII